MALPAPSQLAFNSSIPLRPALSSNVSLPSLRQSSLVGTTLTKSRRRPRAVLPWRTPRMETDRNPDQEVGALPPVKSRSADPDKKYQSWSVRIFLSIFTGYASFYLARNSLTHVAPMMRATLAFLLVLLIVISVFPLAYGFLKLIPRIHADRLSTRVFMTAGLVATGAMFGFQTSLYLVIAFWLANGFFQAAGAPPCAKLLTNWYSKSERGTWWGFWNTICNTGGFLIPLLAGYSAGAIGLQYGLIMARILCIGMGLMLLNRFRDNLQVSWLPPVDMYRGDAAAQKKKLKAAGVEDESLTPRQKLFQYVLQNPYFWFLATPYVFAYFGREGLLSWARKFLPKYKHVSDAQPAALRVSGTEVGRCLGSSVSPEKMMRKRRTRIVALSLIGVIAFLCAPWFVLAASRYLSWLLRVVFAIGFYIYGPEMLVELAGAEIAFCLIIVIMGSNVKESETNSSLGIFCFKLEATWMAESSKRFKKRGKFGSESPEKQSSGNARH